MIIVCLATGFEEIEALTPVDILRRGGLDVKTVAIGTETKTVTGSHGISVIADMSEGQLVARSDYPACVEHLILPGGMPGSLNLDASALVDALLRSVSERGGHIGAICAAPLVLGRRGMLRGHNATCFSGFEHELLGANIIHKDAVTSGSITTGSGMEAALAFSKAFLAAITEAAPECASEQAKADQKEDGEANMLLNDSLFCQAVEVALNASQISTSLLQRKLSIGFGRAAKYIDMMEDLGIVTERCGQKPRRVLISAEQWQEMLSKR